MRSVMPPCDSSRFCRILSKKGLAACLDPPPPRELRLADEPDPEPLRPCEPEPEPDRVALEAEEPETCEDESEKFNPRRLRGRSVVEPSRDLSNGLDRTLTLGVAAIGALPWLRNEGARLDDADPIYQFLLCASSG
jgi:hypothetical protein